MDGRDQIHQQYLCTLCNTIPLHMYYTDADRPEKKDQLLNPMCTAWLHKLSIQQLFVSYG